MLNIKEITSIINEFITLLNDPSFQSYLSKNDSLPEVMTFIESISYIIIEYKTNKQV